jgi:multiple antibiotic resistance protein
MKFNPSEIFMFLFATIGPLEVTIVCATLTADASPEFLKKVAIRSVLIASIVCILFALVGEAILHLFKVSVPAFQIGGGVIVMCFSVELVMGGMWSGNAGAGGPKEKSDEPSLDIATYPLAIPLMASVPGLVAIVSLLAQQDDLSALAYLASVIVVIMAINYLSLRSCKYLLRAVGPVTLQVASKIMGVILASLAVELVLMGLISLGLIANLAERSARAAPSASAKALGSQGFTNRRILSPSVSSTWGIGRMIR